MTTADAATAATRSSRSPVAGLRVLGRPTLYLLGLASALKALALVGMASALTGGIVGVIDGTDSWRQALLWGFASAALRAGVTWAQRVIAARALLGTKERLRADLAERLVSGGGVRVGSHTTLATQGLDELDKYFTVFLPAMVNAACLPLLVGARILFADWVSALIVVLTVPLIPLFMALIGMHTQERVADATTALARLSDHLVELARGLPVLIGLGRAREQVQALRGISEGFRIRTMQTLRTAFLSSFALELIATISVAVVAVFIGVRLVAGTMPLELGLLALLLAPECFTPFREVGTAFHSAQDGREALDRVTRVLDAPLARSIVVAQAGQVRVQGLGVRYADRAEDAITGLTFEAPRNSVTVIDGPSGAGKSTVLAVLAGRLRNTDSTPLSESSATPASAVTITGTVTGVDPAHVAWLPQHPHTVADTVQEELALYAADSDFAAARIHSLLATLGLAHLASADPIRLSPGELRRLAFARVLLRVDAGAELVLLDEPTAHLDAASVTAVLSLISGLRGRATVIMASHDDEVRALADHTVRLGEAAGARPAFDRLAEADAEASAISETAGPETEDSGLREGSAFRELALFLRPVAGRIIGTLVLGTLAATFAIALTAVSAWLIVRASEQPPIMYLLVAIVGVRFFGIGRAVLRYSERLLGHDAVFSALTTLRLRLWTGLADKGATRRSLLSGASTLDRLVRDADQVRDLSLRVVMPVLVGAATMLAAIVGLALISQETVPLLLALAAMALIVAPAVALAADRASSRGEQELRSTVLRRFAALLEAADELRVNGVDGVVRHQLRTLDAAASRTARRGAWALGLGGAIIVAACSITALLVLPLTAQSVASGALDGALVAVLVLTPLGLIDPLLDLVGGVQQWPALRAMLRRVSVITTPETVGDDSSAASGASRHEVPPTVTSLQLQDVTARWPGTSTPVFAPLTAEVARGEWLVVTGRSGSGKSTLLTLLLGHLSAETGRYLVNGTDTATMDAAALRRHFAWCPQEGHLFDSTLRANLLIARTRSDAPDNDEMLDALRGVGLGPLLSRLPQGLDTLIGSSGSLLSGGERQRVAVARTLLTRSDVILIDEPTAHLDEEAAEALMADLRVGLADRITVLVTHLAVGLRPDDMRVHLSPAVSGTGGEGHRQPLSVNVGAPA